MPAIYRVPTKHQVKVHNIKVTTVEQPGRESSGKLCDSCEAPCCKTLIPLLTEAEFLSGQYPIRVVDIPELKERLPNAENVIGLAVFDEGCPFQRGTRCSIYKRRPKACRVYDCRADPRMADFCKKRFPDSQP